MQTLYRLHMSRIELDEVHVYAVWINSESDGCGPALIQTPNFTWAESNAQQFSHIELRNQFTRSKLIFEFNSAYVKYGVWTGDLKC